MSRTLASIALAASFGSIATTASVHAGDEPSLATMTEEARKVANDLLAQVRGEWSKALEFSGPLRAMVVCKYSVPELSSAVSRRTGWKVSRVSLRPRNPVLGTADAWEQRVLLEFDRRVERGERAEDLGEVAQIVEEPQGRYFRYMKALPVGPLCAGCHGQTPALTDAVKATLEAEYPHDRGGGVAVGKVRGAVTIKRPLSPS